MAIHKMPGHEDIDDEDLTCFVIIPGRYYLAQWCVSIPNAGSKFGKGGDCTALVWRKADEPEEWTFQYRWRWYKTQGPWDGKDEKSWFAGHAVEAEAEILQNMRKMFGILAAAAGHRNTGEFLIQGDNEKFAHLMQTQPPSWMHQQSVVVE